VNLNAPKIMSDATILLDKKITKTKKRNSQKEKSKISNLATFK